MLEGARFRGYTRIRPLRLPGSIFTSSIIGIAIILLGQAVASYEVFTGKTLPRRGLLRHWRLVLILAAGYSVLASGSIVIHLRPLYSLLLTTGLIPCFYALFSWCSYIERDRYIAYLRLFVSSQHLYDFDEVNWQIGPEVEQRIQSICTLTALGAPGQTNQGSGQGLALHSTMMSVVGGVLTIDSTPDKYTRVSLTLSRGKW